MTEAAPFGVLTLILWGAMLAAAAACTVLAVRHHAATSDGDPSDPLFWDLFGGAAVIVPALLIPAVASPPAGFALAALTCASGVAAYRSSPRVLSWYSSRRQRRQELRDELPARQAAAMVFHDAVLLHDAVLKRWQRYELDPALAIDYPDMSDVARPQTAEFVKAMRVAELLRTSGASGYPSAVAQLERALECAEAAAGVAPAVCRETAAGTSAAIPSGQQKW
ncbi:hypothetical protein [Arthrobacter sp. D1-17]